MQTKKPSSRSTKAETAKKEEVVELEEQVKQLEENDDYESLEDDTVRIYTTKKELLPGVEVDFRVFRVYLTDSMETYLEFREPNTKEILKIAEDKKGKNIDKFLELISTLSCGPIEATSSLLNRLPVKFQYKIVRTIEHITESQGTRLV